VQAAAIDNRFEPARIRIDPGTTVTWVNQGAMAHNVAKAADALDFGAPFGVATGDFGPGARSSFRFTKAGIFPYVCTIHTLMNGVVVVGDGPFPATADAGGS
jgi:plastocyanin